MLRHFIRSSREFWTHWTTYLLLFISLNVVVLGAVVGLNAGASWILSQQKIPYLSYTNLAVLWQKPFATLMLLVLLLILLVLVFSQFAYLLLGMRQIKQHRFAFRPLLKEVWGTLRQLDCRSLTVLTGYFLLILPIAQVIFQSQLLSKVVVPAFIVEFFMSNVLYMLIFFLVVAVIGYIAIRLIYVLPLMILEGLSARQAIQRSLDATEDRFLRLALMLFGLTLLASLPRVLSFGGIIIGQEWFDTWPKPFPLIWATVNLSVLQIINLIGGAWLSVVLLSYLLEQPVLTKAIDHQEPYVAPEVRQWMRKLAKVVIAVTGVSIVGTNIIFLTGMDATTPLTISHRGVDGLDEPNGAQNTIPALVKTMEVKPDYVEMDIQETKDGQFVVMHDPNLKQLTGVDGAPQDFTLAELQAMTVQENGYQAPVPSFDEYLQTADAQDQKLLVEIKTSKKDSKDMMTRFIKQYETHLREKGHAVQSLNYQVVETLKKGAPQLKVAYILPYNFIYPNTEADAYTMEATTLNRSFTTKAHATQRKVFAWTINDEETMNRVMGMHVDGVITDEVSLLKQTIADEKNNTTYAEKLANYVSIMPDPGSGVAS